ncbi:hypothetical protein V493_05521 [Pseudogymnoascus sp. VKM F-4281 (FW-2241)]|nr:hypothetical protein V493_05521 [Pseudogymnoascus sp. VKM F-4281 (FW-2241)]
MVTTPEEQPAAGALHRVPSAADLSTDSDADSLTSTQARLICPSSRHIAQRDYRSTIHPTTVLRIIAAILFIASLSIFAISPSHAIPALVFIPLTLLRILSVFIFHTPRGARWRGWRGINLGVDLALVVAVCGSVGCVLAERNNYLYASLRMLSRVGIILGWVAVGFFAVAAADTGRPTKFAFTTTLSLDFWTEDGALSLDNWEVGPIFSLLGRPLYGQYFAPPIFFSGAGGARGVGSGRRLTVEFYYSMYGTAILGMSGEKNIELSPTDVPSQRRSTSHVNRSINSSAAETPIRILPAGETLIPDFHSDHSDHAGDGEMICAKVRVSGTTEIVKQSCRWQGCALCRLLATIDDAAHK